MTTVKNAGRSAVKSDVSIPLSATGAETAFLQQVVRHFLRGDLMSELIRINVRDADFAYYIAKRRQYVFSNCLWIRSRRNL